MIDGRHPPIDGIHRRWLEPAGPRTGDVPLVLLHEGLGSISSWGPFPQALADGCGRPLLVYDRPGYGRSAPLPGPWPARYMHHGAEVLGQLLAAEGVDRAVLVGHSDGATIALLYPACAEVGAAAIDGIVSISAHVFVEPRGVAAIGELRACYRDDLAARLSRHHDDADATFEAWSEVWLSDRFRPWTIDADLAAVTCPVLVIQGADDAYGTDAQVRRVATAVTGPCHTELLDGVDHWPHKETPDEVIDLVDAFLRHSR